MGRVFDIPLMDSGYKIPIFRVFDVPWLAGENAIGMAFDPLSMVHWTPYPWYFEPPTHGISKPYPWDIEPPIHAILIPYPWNIEPLIHGISNAIPMAFSPASHGTSISLNIGILYPLSINGISNTLPMEYQTPTLTFVRLSGTSENWRRTSRSCITVVRWYKWKNQIPKRAGMTDKSDYCSYISNIDISVHWSVSEIATLILSMSLNFIKAWMNDKWYQ
jgi:hypothetical protein